MEKLISAVSYGVILIGFTVTAGTAGASDLNTIGLKTTVVNASIGMIIIAAGVLLLRIRGRVC